MVIFYSSRVEIISFWKNCDFKINYLYISVRFYRHISRNFFQSFLLRNDSWDSREREREREILEEDRSPEKMKREVKSNFAFCKINFNQNLWTLFI